MNGEKTPIPPALFERKKSGFFKMQIADFLGLTIAGGNDAVLTTDDVSRSVEHFRANGYLAPGNGLVSLPEGDVTISMLSRWFVENQLVSD